jgi:hypothetical protein
MIVDSEANLDARIKKYLAELRKEEGLFGETIDRWVNDQEGEKIVGSIKRQENKYFAKNPNAWPTSAWLVLNLLLSNLRIWMEEMKAFDLERKPMRPAERSATIERIGENAGQILSDFKALGLPRHSFNYLTVEELSGRFRQLLEFLDLSHVSDERLAGLVENPKIYLDLLIGKYPEADLCVSDLLLKLTDNALLDTLAEQAIVTKTDAKSGAKIFMIRKLASWFTARYGKPLHQTTANLCVLVFDDTGIDRDTVRSALSGYDINTEPDWQLQFPEIIEKETEKLF